MTTGGNLERTDTPTPGWFDRPMRWAQLTLAENDPAQYDLNFWLDYFQRIRADAACLSAAGCVAYYPSQVPYHYVTPYLNGRDAFGELYAGCRRLGMTVIARTDPHAMHRDAFEAHPEWAAVDAEGNPRRHWADPELWVTCALGPYNFEQMTAITTELVSRYPVDGVFSNRWSGHGICYCASCTRLFRQATGFDLPRGKDPRDPAFRAYTEWRQHRLFELWQVWDGAIRAVNPAARFIPNTGGGALSDLNMRRIGELSEILFADRQARRGLEPIWTNGKNAKEYRAAMGRKPVGGIFSMGVEEPYRWKDSVQSPAEIRMFVADGVANGLRPWFTKFCGMVYDPRWLDTVAQLYNQYADWEPYLRNETPLAQVGLVYSQRTAQYYGGEQARAKVEDPIRGWYQALIEARIPFEMVHDELLDPAHTAPFNTLILPNTAALSDAQCQQLRDYVAGGGSLIASYETSLYDEWGQPRPDFGLAGLFGVRYLGGTEGPMQNSYLNLERDRQSGAFHPLLAGLEEAGRIINGVRRVLVAPAELAAPAEQAESVGPAGDNPPLTLIPSYPDLPMEMVWVRVPHTDTPGVFIREYGRGRVIYFPWDIDRTFWEVLSVDHGRLLQNAVRWLSGRQPVEVSGPGVLDVTAWAQRSSLTVHLVNLTNPMMMKGPIRELLPVGEQVVRLRLPAGRLPRRVHLLRSGITPSAVVEDGWLEVRVPSVLDHEVVAVDMGEDPLSPATPVAPFP